MLLFNAVVLSVIVMLALSIARVHVVISLFVASLVGGLVAGMGMSGTMVAFQDGLAGGAKIALSYACSARSRCRWPTRACRACWRTGSSLSCATLTTLTRRAWRALRSGASSAVSSSWA